jgi:CheY-like chemotaxis protein
MAAISTDRDQPIVVVEDDLDDQEILKHVMKSLHVKNEILIFNNGFDAFNYLKNTTRKTFIILCDINLQLMDGIEFRNKINEDEQLKRKSIPFIFLSTAATETQVDKAYSTAVQGFFVKAVSMKEFERKLDVILRYWAECKTPNSFRD